MKNLIVILTWISPLILFGQNFIEDNFPTENGLIKYSEIVQVNSTLTSNDLYLNAKNWLVEAFKSSTDVIQTDDKDKKLLVGKGFVSKGHNVNVTNPKNWFIIKIEMKDGRYKYSLYDITYEFDVYYGGQSLHTEKPFEEWMKPSDKPMSDKKRQKIDDELNKYCKELDSEFRAVINSMKTSMNKINNDNW